jgi:hypothetical protein
MADRAIGDGGSPQSYIGDATPSESAARTSGSLFVEGVQLSDREAGIGDELGDRRVRWHPPKRRFCSGSSRCSRYRVGASPCSTKGTCRRAEDRRTSASAVSTSGMVQVTSLPHCRSCRRATAATARRARRADGHVGGVGRCVPAASRRQPARSPRRESRWPGSTARFSRSRSQLRPPVEPRTPRWRSGIAAFMPPATLMIRVAPARHRNPSAPFVYAHSMPVLSGVHGARFSRQHAAVQSAIRVGGRSRPPLDKPGIQRRQTRLSGAEQDLKAGEVRRPAADVRMRKARLLGQCVCTKCGTTGATDTRRSVASRYDASCRPVDRLRTKPRQDLVAQQPDVSAAREPACRSTRSVTAGCERWRSRSTRARV